MKTKFIIGLVLHIVTLIYIDNTAYSQLISSRRVFHSHQAELARVKYNRAIKDATEEFSSRIAEARHNYLESLATTQKDLASRAYPNSAELLRISNEQKRIAELIAAAEPRAEQVDRLPSAIATIKISARQYELGLFRDGELTYRNHKDQIRWKQIPIELDGWEFTRFTRSEAPQVYVTAVTAGFVFVVTNADVAKYPEHPLMKAGWKPLNYNQLSSKTTRSERVVLDDTANNPAKWMVFYHYFEQGEEAQIPQDGYAGAPIVVPSWHLVRE